MADYIERVVAFNAILKLVPKVDGDGYCWVIRGDAAQAIDSIPSADVAEVRHGKWEVVGINTYELSYGGTAYEPFYRCNKCKMITESYLRLDEPIMPEDASFPNFCPNCGADMRKPPKGKTDADTQKESNYE